MSPRRRGFRDQEDSDSFCQAAKQRDCAFKDLQKIANKENQWTFAIITSTGKPVNRDMVFQSFAGHFVKYSKDQKLPEAELKLSPSNAGSGRTPQSFLGDGCRKGKGSSVFLYFFKIVFLQCWT